LLLLNVHSCMKSSPATQDVHLRRVSILITPLMPSPPTIAQGTE
jgi:hypothetical protein